MRLLPPIDAHHRVGKPSHDLAKGAREDKGYSLYALETLLRDCEDQPPWRDMADLCCAYYDGSQMTAQQEFEYRKNKLDPRSMNLVGRVINGVLGQEAKSRRDPRLEPDDDEHADVCDVLNVRLKEAQRETYADMAVSNAYASQVKAGLGWAEISRNADPYQYQYRVTDVHRSEMWWDWRAKRLDLSDARWLCRRQWKDLDEVIAVMPEFQDALENAVNNWANWLTDDLSEERLMSQNPFYATDRRFAVNRSEWVDGGRRRVRMYEVWYRVPAEVVVMRVGHRWVPLDPGNPLHVEAVSRRLVPLKKAITLQVRRAIFAGPYRLVDEATRKTRFPYVPFFAFRADADQTPYGLIHGMIAPQDEYNERRMRIQWMLKSQQLMVDRDALDEGYNTIEDIAASMMRPDMVAVLNPARRRDNGLQFRNDFQLQKEQFEVMQDAKGLIQDVPGIYSTQLGDAPSGVTSGVAISGLVEQGIVAMGELNDNYSLSRRLVFDQLVDLIAEDHADADMRVAIGAGQTRRVVVLNTKDPETLAPVNVVKDAKVTTGLAEVPATPAYMAQMSTLMADMIRALAGTPQAALLVPAWVENTSAFGSSRKMLADDMRRMSGLPVSGDRVSAQQWQQQQQEQTAKNAKLQEAAATAELQAKGAKTALDQAKTALTHAQRFQTLVQADALANDPDEQGLIDSAIQEAMPRQAQEPEAVPA